MPVDAFIMFTPPDTFGPDLKPKGETMDSVFSKLDAFEVKDFSFGIENKATIGSSTSGAGGGKVQFNEFTIKKPTDQASTIFFKNCCAGAHYPTVTLAIRKAGADPQSTGKPYLVFNFGVVFTTKIDWSGPGDEGPEESITFAYGAMQINYFKQDKTGKMVAAPATSWDQMLNKGSFPGAAVTTF
jgi:type VI secretion system secreted protein Hcp